MSPDPFFVLTPFLCRPPAAPFAVSDTARRPLPPSLLLSSLSSLLLMPDAAADPSSRHCVRQALFIPPCRAGSLRCGECGRVAPLVRFAFFIKEVASHRLVRQPGALRSIFWVVSMGEWAFAGSHANKETSFSMVRGTKHGLRAVSMFWELQRLSPRVDSRNSSASSPAAPLRPFLHILPAFRLWRATSGLIGVMLRWSRLTE